MLWSKRNFKRGFTLVELMVTISIFVILTGVVIFNQGKFNSTILLTNLGYDTALTIRQAQTYGINVKEFGENEFYPYGVHFSTAPESKKSFILFTDVKYPIGKIAHVYGFGNNNIDLSLCHLQLGCVSRYNIKSGNFISDLKVDGSTVDSLDILFQRPNPDAIIISSPVQTINKKAEITISTSDQSASTTILIQSNGLIEVVK